MTFISPLRMVYKVKVKIKCKIHENTLFIHNYIYFTNI